MATRQKPTDVEEFLETVSPAQRKTLKKLRQLIRSIIPDADECLSYALPAFRWQGKPLVAYNAWKEHAALYPMSGTVFTKLKDELQKYSLSKGTIRFDPQKLLPKTLLKKIIQLRKAEIEAKER
ncbi:MAG: DUF1801 domain-containing protein [Gemmatales bacterium]